MKKFRFFSHTDPNRRLRSYLSDSQKELSTIFLPNQIKDGMFTKSVMKRLNSAHDGTIIILRTHRNKILLGIKVINNDEAKIKKQNIKLIKAQLDKLLKTYHVVQYIELKKKYDSLLIN